MIISSTAFGILVSTALLLTVAAPILLIVLLIRDWKEGRLW